MGKIYSIREGDAYSWLVGDLFQSIIIEKNNPKRLSYWIYNSADENYVFHDIVKPSELAKKHLDFIYHIKKKQNRKENV